MDIHAQHDDSVGSDLLVELLCTGAVPSSNYSCKAAKKTSLWEIHYQTLVIELTSSF